MMPCAPWHLGNALTKMLQPLLSAEGSGSGTGRSGGVFPTELAARSLLAGADQSPVEVPCCRCGARVRPPREAVAPNPCPGHAVHLLRTGTSRGRAPGSTGDCISAWNVLNCCRSTSGGCKRIPNTTGVTALPAPASSTTQPQPHDVRSPRGQGTLGWPPLGRSPSDTQPAPTGSPSAGFASLWSRNAKPQASESPREALGPLLCGAALPHAQVSGAQLRHEHRCGPVLYPSAAGRCSPYGINHWGTSRTGWQNEELPSLITIEPAVAVPAIWRGWAPLAHKGAAPQPAGQLRARGRGSTGGLPLPMGHQVGEEPVLRTGPNGAVVVVSEESQREKHLYKLLGQSCAAGVKFVILGQNQ